MYIILFQKKYSSEIVQHAAHIVIGAKMILKNNAQIVKSKKKNHRPEKGDNEWRNRRKI